MKKKSTTEKQLLSIVDKLHSFFGLLGILSIGGAMALTITLFYFRVGFHIINAVFIGGVAAMCVGWIISYPEQGGGKKP